MSKKRYHPKISGHLEVVVDNQVHEHEGVVEKWQSVIIHGDPKGLRSLAKVLMDIAEMKQKKEMGDDIQHDPRVHFHIPPNFQLSKSSVEVIVGRLDAHGTGEFYDSFIPRETRKVLKDRADAEHKAFMASQKED